MAVAVSRFRMGDENRQIVHPFFASRDCANTTPGLSEEFGNRRKRRRTSSPNAGPLASQNGFICATENAPKEWENQLRAAANGEGSTPMGCSEPPHTSQTEPRKNDIMKRRVIQPTSLSNIARHTSSVLQVEITKTKLEECGNKFGALPKQRTTTPPKTMLAIRSDGKLVSPKLQIAAPYPNSKRRKQEPELGGKTKEKIVKIKYGSSDESRKYLAQKIHDICSGMTVRPDELIKNPKVFEPAIVAKPTHPFFLGTNSRNKEPKVACESSAVGDSIRLDGECKQNINISLEKADAQITLSTNTNADATLPTLKEISYSLGIPRPVRFHGAKEPIWPPKDMGHVRPQMHMIAAPAASTTASHISYRRRKLKYAKIHIAEQEEILCLYSNLVNSQVMCKGDDNPQTMNKFGQPNRKIMTGPELQNAIHSLLTFKVPGIATLQPKEFQKDALGGLRTVPGDTHSALLRVFKEISTSRTAFDRFECETHDWTYKYAPKRAEEVLQLGREALILRDWLKSLTVTSIGSGSSALPKGQDKSIPSRMFDANSKRKKRKRAEKLDGFVISSDEETVEMEGLVNPEAGESDAHDIALGKKSIIRATNISGHPTERQRAANAIVISGPHGCGKTAAVFAVARELDFEVFEINSGSRRSGKDVLEKVGDVTKNHLVNQAGDTKKDGVAKSVADIAEFPITATSSSYQGTVRALLQPKAEMKKKPRGRPKKLAKDPNTDDNSNKKQSQKQSLILLEEVDVLFEEDRQFWATTLDLILHSKRPIIMTCTDESLLPLDEMFLFAVLRFTPPPEPLAIDYLLLVASNEGHLLSRKALSHLLRSKHSDLRASLTELNFFCQMAIGDTKGGLEWMLIQSSSTNNQIQEDKNLRVVSLGTYSEDLDYSNRLQQNLKTKAHTHGAEKFASGIWECWNGDANYSSGHHITSSLVNERRRKQELALERLVAFEHVIDAISAADTHLFSEHRQNELTKLDPSLPEVSERFRMNFIESSTVLQAEPVIDHSGVSTSLSQVMRVYATQLQYESSYRPFTSLDHECAMKLVPDLAQKAAVRTEVTRAGIATAFASIAELSRLPHTAHKGTHISSFDGPMSSICEDVAPYVRSIVFYDLKLEEHRLQLNLLLAQNGRNGKRMRTTRASHAALEGGNKAHTRRERWFPADSNFSLILQSGGHGWQQLAWQRTLDQSNGEPEQDTNISSIYAPASS